MAVGIAEMIDGRSDVGHTAIVESDGIVGCDDESAQSASSCCGYSQKC